MASEISVLKYIRQFCIENSWIIFYIMLSIFIFSFSLIHLHQKPCPSPCFSSCSSTSILIDRHTRVYIHAVKSNFLRPCLDPIKKQKVFKIPHHIESCSTCMKH